ncbi:unnamed protein product [Closterium sp. Yama58-4]|nr:unnamed protein product [Closterium sp. Yama58-4]
MKPNNLLIGPTGELKIADYGYARLFGSPDRKLTHQVFALWYRAPELLFGSKAYGSGVDVWGAGCVFAELLLRRPFLQVCPTLHCSATPRLKLLLRRPFLQVCSPLLCSATPTTSKLTLQVFALWYRALELLFGSKQVDPEVQDHPEAATKLTHQVFALWYCAPELLFGSKAYGSAVDVWGAGCVFAELLLRRPFLQESIDIDQLGKIFAALSTPREDQWPDMQCLPDNVHFNFFIPLPLPMHLPSSPGLSLLPHSALLPLTPLPCASPPFDTSSLCLSSSPLPLPFLPPLPPSPLPHVSQGSSDIDQLGKIFAALGTPREDQWPDMQCLPDYVHFNFCPAPPLKSHFPMAGDDALDLLSRMLTFDPNKRITAAQALQHR